MRPHSKQTERAIEADEIRARHAGRRTDTAACRRASGGRPPASGNHAPGFVLAGLIALSWLGAAACVTFRPAPRPPGPEVEAFLTCANVVSSGGLLAPEGAADAFGANAASVCAFVRLRDVGRDIGLRWRWYGPDGRLARDSGPVAVRTEGQRLDTVTAFDRLDFAAGGPDRVEGAWTVVLFVEDVLAEQKEFLRS